MWYHNQVDTTSGRLAQLVEHLLDVQEVTGSSPVPSTKRKPLTKVRGFFVASATVSCQSRTVQDSNRAALTTPVGRVSNQPSATTTTAACGRNREELLGPRSDFSKPRQGAVEKSANATRCCCLARSSWTRRNVYQGRTNPILYEKGFGYVFCLSEVLRCVYARTQENVKVSLYRGVLSWGSVVYSA